MNYAEVKRLVEKKGYVLDGITSFKKKDRIRFHSAELKVSLDLGKKIKDLSWADLNTWIY